MIGVTCRTCCFFSPHPHISQRGQCRAEPPKLSFEKIEGKSQVKSVWPHVKDNDFCGHHSTREG